MTCSHCDAALDNWEHIGRSDVTPRVGACIVCFECGEPSLFESDADGGLVVRAPSALELKGIYARPDMRALRQARAQHPDSPYDAVGAARLSVQRVDSDSLLNAIATLPHPDDRLAALLLILRAQRS